MVIGFAITGSFCTFSKVKTVIQSLVKEGNRVVPIFSDHVQKWDTRFANAKDFIKEVQEITGEKGIFTVQEAEPIGPSGYLDVLAIAPCTGNTLAKLNAGITDSPVLMAAKAHLRNNKPLVIAISTNDAMGMNFKTIGSLYVTKNIYFVPFGQDDYEKKPASLIAHLPLLSETIREARNGRQLQPVLRSYNSNEI